MSIETAGARLKKIRQERGLSLEDVQKKTKIHLNILRAIEGDSVSNLSPIYLKSFIKIYCAALGLEPKDYTETSFQSSRPILNATIGRPIGERFERKQRIKDAPVNPIALKPSLDFKKIIIYPVFALVIIFLGVNLIKFITSRRKHPIDRAKILMPVSSKKIVLPQKKGKATKQQNPQVSIAEGFTVGISARSKSWISAKIDGKLIFHGVLARGRSESWHAKDKIELSLGNASAVVLEVNGQRFDNLGTRGKPVKNVIINKEGLKISR